MVTSVVGRVSQGSKRKVGPYTSKFEPKIELVTNEPNIPGLTEDLRIEVTTDEPNISSL